MNVAGSKPRHGLPNLTAVLRDLRLRYSLRGLEHQRLLITCKPYFFDYFTAVLVRAKHKPCLHNAHGRGVHPQVPHARAAEGPREGPPLRHPRSSQQGQEGEARPHPQADQDPRAGPAARQGRAGEKDDRARPAPLQEVRRRPLEELQDPGATALLTHAASRRTTDPSIGGPRHRPSGRHRRRGPRASMARGRRACGHRAPAMRKTPRPGPRGPVRPRSSAGPG